jgi:hypothetical protein
MLDPASAAQARITSDAMLLYNIGCAEDILRDPTLDSRAIRRIERGRCWRRYLQRATTMPGPALVPMARNARSEGEEADRRLPRNSRQTTPCMADAS